MIHVQTYSKAGGHPQNEDTFAVEMHPLDPECCICLVADGQGGQSGGGPASLLACKTSLIAAFGMRPERLIEPSTWVEIARQTDTVVAADRIAGFTTLVGLCVYRGRVAGASNGDSAALLISNGSPVNLTAKQLKNPPIGSGAVVSILFSAVIIEPWKVLAMSDGVWKYVGWNRVVEFAQKACGPTLISQLQKAARLPGNNRFQDDVTMVLLEAPPP